MRAGLPTHPTNPAGTKSMYGPPNRGGGRWQVSCDGGLQRHWSVNGKELYYRIGDKMMVASVVTQPTFSSGRPRVLFEGSFQLGGAVNDYELLGAPEPPVAHTAGSAVCGSSIRQHGITLAMERTRTAKSAVRATSSRGAYIATNNVATYAPPAKKPRQLRQRRKGAKRGQDEVFSLLCGARVLCGSV
jgi:hypothetical protein